MSIHNIYAQIKYNEIDKEYLKSLYSDINYKKVIDNKSNSSNSYFLLSLRNHFGALNEMVLITQDEEIIQEQIKIINNIINAAVVSKDIENNRYKYKDGYKGWISLQDNGTLYKEVPLYESYSFFYITQFLYILKDLEWIYKNDENLTWWKNTLEFVEINIWNKWRSRSVIERKKENFYFLRERVHMGSHWAGIAIYLEEITENSRIRRQAQELYFEFNLLLRRNLKTVGNRFLWNSTYDNIAGTDAFKDKNVIVQDVAHGNHVISYVVAAYELGKKEWTIEDIEKFANTFKLIIYNKKEHRFSDNVDGTQNKKRLGWGSFIGDGWVKLANYDKEIIDILRSFDNDLILDKYDQKIQYKVTLYKTTKNE